MNKLLTILLFIIAPLSSSFAQTQILWEDKFNDNTKGWTVKDKEDYKTEIGDGHYKIQHKTSNSYYFIVEHNIDPYSDFYIEAKLKQTEGVQDYGHGIFLKDERIFGGYRENYFVISSSGFFKINTYDEKTKEFTNHQDWKETTAINKGYDIDNVLAIKKTGAITAFYINNIKVFEQSHSKFWGSWNGFIVYNTQKILVDHLIVKQDRGKINLAHGSENEVIVKENLGSAINSQYSEIMPVISPDGQTLYLDVKDDPSNTGYIKNVKDSKGKVISTATVKDDVWFSNINKDGTWGKRKNLGPPINNSSHNFVISVSPDNNSLILSGQYTTQGDWKAVGLSITHRTKKGWSIPEDMKIDDYYIVGYYTSFCISPDRNVLILAVERNDTYGYIDLYVSFRKGNGTWTAPFNMGHTLNTYGYEVAPFIAADGKTLYYSTNGKLGYGSNDIFMSKRLDESWTKWSEPQNLGPKVNSTDWDAYYTIPASGDYAYMVSDDHSLGEEDIFRVKVSHTAKPEPVVIIYGKVLNKNTKEPLAADITYHDINEDKDVGIARSNPSDGSYKIILPYGKLYGFLAEKTNFLSESDNIDLTEIKEFIQIERNLYLTPIEIGKSITLNNVFFEKSKAVLLPGSKIELERLVKILKDNPTINIELSGHTDNVGNPDINVHLSENRVKAIKDYLVSKGISGKRITGKGYGGSKPIASNETEESRKLNRRVEFKIVGK